MKTLTRVAAIALAALTATAHAIEIRISAKALERTLAQQLFTGPDGKYFIKGTDGKPCYVYAQSPTVTFKDDRVVVHVKTKSRLGAGMMGSCIGIGLTTDADVSVMPEAEGESIGFRDARIDNLSASKELSFLLVPFLSKKLPQKMKVNAADLLKQILATSTASTGYDMKLDELHIHSMQVSGDALVVDFDGKLSVK